MKKFLVVFLLLVGSGVFAEEAITLPETPVQVIEIEKSGAIAILQKQPTAENQKQVIKIKKSGGFLLIQINGKVKDTDSGVQSGR